MSSSQRSRWRFSTSLPIALGFVLTVSLLSLPTGDADAVTSKPDAVTSLSVVPGYQGAELTWTVGSDGGSPITDFLITVH